MKAEERVVPVVAPTRTTPPTAVKCIPVNIAIYNRIVLCYRSYIDKKGKVL